MGRIYFLKTPEKNTIFPVTRAEGVLYEDTTVGKTLDSIKDGSEIPEISNDDIDEIFGAIEPSEPSEPGSGETKVVYAKDVLFDNSDTAIVGDNVQSAIVFVSNELNKEVQRAKQTEQNIVSSAVSSTDNSHGVKVTLGGTIGKQQITVETSIGGVNAANSGLVSGDSVHNALVGTSYLATTSSNGIMSKQDKANINESIKSLSASGTTITYTRADGTTGNITTQDTNTTYSFAGGTNKFTVTPSGGTAQDVSVTPSIANNVTYSGTLISGQVAVLDGTTGKIKASGYTIAKSVPNDAVFTDTHYTAKNVVSNSASSTANVAASNGDVHINLVENNTCRSGIKIVGSGATQVVSDEWGNIIITSDDTNTTYVAMKGATSTANGTQGLVPAPMAGNQAKYLRGDGTWQTPKDTTYDTATTTVAGLMSAADKQKLDGIANSANAYSLPNATSTTLGGVKVGSNITLNNGTISLTKSNVTSALGYTPPTTATTYGIATSTSNGLMSSQMVGLLNGAAQTDHAISASDAINGVGVTIGGTIGKPTIKVSVNGGAIAQNSSSVVSAGDVHSALVNDTYIKAIELDYIDELFK